MSYIEKNLLKNEEIKYRTRLHWVTFIGPIVLFIVGGFCLAWPVSGLSSDIKNIISIVGIIIMLVAVFYSISDLIAFLTSEFGVTNQRVLIKVGLIRRNTFELLLNKVESFQIKQTIMGRFLGYGTILISGTGMGQEVFNNIDHPLELKSNVQQFTKEYERKFLQPQPLTLPASF